jgi:hypothetical protein
MSHVPVCLSYVLAGTGQPVKNYAVIDDTPVARLLIETILLNALGNPATVEGSMALTFGPTSSAADASAYNAAQARGAAGPRKTKGVKRSKSKKKKTKKKGDNWVTLKNGKKLKMKKKR